MVTWPPPTLEVNAAAIADECEMAEMQSTPNTPMLEVRLVGGLQGINTKRRKGVFG